MRKHKIWKKCLGILLTSFMLIQCAVPVYAEEGDGTDLAGQDSAAILQEGGTESTVPDEAVSDPGSTVVQNPGEYENFDGQGDETEIPDSAPSADGGQAESVPSEEGAGTAAENEAEAGGVTEAGEAQDPQKAKIGEPELSQASEPAKPVLKYSAHAQTYGWMDEVSDGESAGTTGEKKRLEAVRIRIEGLSQGTENGTGAQAEALTGSVEYKTHSQTVGWKDWVSDGAVGGTEGMGKRLEAICIRLTGTLAEKYDIYYKVHCATFGDLGWAKNGEMAGSEGFAKSIEAITIRLIEKGSQDAPEQSKRSYFTPSDMGNVTYTSHVQTYGWMQSVADGQMSGTTGQKKRMEAMKIYLSNPAGEDGVPLEGGITYRAHSQSYGWMDWVQEGEVAGTEGKGKRLEAFQIQLTGQMAEQYDIYYKVHCSTWGDLGWAKNGETAGTTGTARSIEALEIRLVKKGSSDAPSGGGRPSIEDTGVGTLTYEPWIGVIGWNGAVTSPAEAGTTGQKKKIEAIKMQLDGSQFEGGITYRAYMQSTGWQDWKSNGEIAGSTTAGKRLESFEVKLTGELEKYCSVYYRAHVEKYGWLGWAKNGQTAGTQNCSYRVEAIQVVITMKTAAAPGSTSGYFQDTIYLPRYNNAIDTIINEAGTDLYSCYSWVVNNLSYQTLPIPMDPPAGYTREEGYAIYAVENRRGNCYCYAAAFAGAAKRLGFSARYIEGGVGLAAGGTGPHSWVEIDIDGTTYVCDPEAEYELGGNFYMVTYGSARLNYQ